MMRSLEMQYALPDPLFEERGAVVVERVIERTRIGRAVFDAGLVALERGDELEPLEELHRDTTAQRFEVVEDLALWRGELQVHELLTRREGRDANLLAAGVARRHLPLAEFHVEADPIAVHRTKS